MERLAERRDNVVAFPPRVLPEPIGDLRFRALLGERWWQLPAAVRARFSKRMSGGRMAHYEGEIVECRMSRAGWWLAQVARLIGGPLPIATDTLVPAAVTVCEDEASGGQHWTRLYARRRGFPQAIHSAKRFAGPTGLEEYVGRGFGIALTLAVEEQTLHFRSDHYFWTAGRLRLRLPRWLSPGAMTVSHVDCGGGWFAFVLALDHPWFGELIRQTGMFRECTAREDAR